MKYLRHCFGALKGTVIIVFTFLLFPFARMLLWHKSIWIVSEHGFEARDNGYVFFKYVREKHPEINCYYAIDYKSTDFEKVYSLGNTIRFGSFKHYLYFCAARYLISSKTQGFCPSYYLSLLRKKMHLWGKYVFLQHGITHNDQKFLYKNNSKIDLFICGAKPEYDDVRKKYGYSEKEVAYTGFARFDTYKNLICKNLVLVFPTWRRYLENCDLMNTDYYNSWQSLLNSKKLSNVLEENGVYLIFTLHPHFKDKKCVFKTGSKNIKILSFNECDLQDLIRSSRLLITDFSSVAFDFGYMKKPVVYYQYDKDNFYKNHYFKGYYDYSKDSFGPVCHDLNSVVESVSNYLENKFKLENRYVERSNFFFQLHDDSNCERIFNAIRRIK